MDTYEIKFEIFSFVFKALHPLKTTFDGHLHSCRSLTALPVSLPFSLNWCNSQGGTVDIAPVSPAQRCRMDGCLGRV